MGLAIVPYTAEHVAAVRNFNGRIAQTGDAFPEGPDPGWMPGMHLYVAVEDGSVRGGYILRSQQFSVSRETTLADHYRLPLSEGVIDRAHASLGMRLVRDALARQPQLYALGMGSWERPLPQMLKAMKWRIQEVPFHFKVVHGGAFLRNIRALRTTAWRRFAMDLAAATGIGSLAAGRRVRGAKFDLVKYFAEWASEVWEQSREAYGLAAFRDAATLQSLYGEDRFLRVRAGDGWAVLLDTQMSGHKQFGDMRVGTIVDCMAPPDGAGPVMRAAAAVLEEGGVDLIVSNQMHTAWSRALVDAGFRKGPSNFLLALSPELAKAAGSGELHFNRGDGDGPIHL
jgi:hypothetical protein